MLIVKQDKTRKEEEGQIFVELTSNRGLDIVNCDRLGYWCDKAHLSHFIMECATCFTQEELKNILKMDNKIEIKEDNVLAAYKTAKEAGADSTMKVLESLFGKEVFKPKNIIDRVKTINDAIQELGEDHPLVQQYRYWMGESPIYDGSEKDLVAYLKLRIITAALNEGWTPQFTEDEYRYYPWYWLYTKEEIAKMSKEERKKVVLFGGAANNGAYAGFAYASSNDAPANTNAIIGSRLCFKSSELAKYAGEQFAEIYLDFMGK